MLAKAQNLASLRLLAWGSVSSYHKSFASGISGGGLSTPHKTAAESGAYEIEKSGDSGASLATNFRQLHLPHSPAAALSVVDITASRCRPLSTLSRPFIHTAVSSQKVCEARLAHCRGYSGTHDEDRDAGSLPPDGNPNVEDTNGTGSDQPEKPGVWGNWIAKRFSGSNNGNEDASSGLESSEAEVLMDAQGSTSAPGGSPQSQFGGIDEGLDAELEALLAQDGDDKWNSGTGGGGEEMGGIQNRGGGWRLPGGGGGVAPGGFSVETPLIEHEISQAARDAIEEYDLEEEEDGSGPPFLYRPGNLYFPGNTYEIEDVDLSVDAPEPEEVQRGGRIRKTYTTAEAMKKADFRNVRFMLDFLSETAKTLPRHKTGLSAKAQRKVSHEIRIARCLGLVPFTSIGKPQYRFQRSRMMSESGGGEYGGSSRPSLPYRNPSPVGNRRPDGL